MKNIFKVRMLVLIMAIFITQVVIGKGSDEILKALKVDYSENPLGIDNLKPKFSWQSDFLKERDFEQEYYQIVVKDSKNKVTWDSGKIKDNSSLGIEYKGEKLKPSTKYSWELTTWSNKGIFTKNSSFETSLLSNSIDAWSGAKWIGGNDKDLVLYSDYLPIYKIQYDLKLDKESKSSKASFVFGANDPRLMDKNKNIYGLENKKDKSYIKVEIDTTLINDIQKGLAKLNIYRVGYTESDKESKPLLSYELPDSIINKDNKFEKHNIYIESNFGLLNIKIDNKFEIATETAGPFTNKGVNINPMGAGSDYIAYPMLADIGFEVANNQKAEFSNLKIYNYREPSNTLFEEKLENYNGIFKNQVNIANSSYVVTGVKEGKFIVADPSKNSMPLLRNEFSISKEIESARLYITSRGVYEASINGNKIGNDYFAPGLTQYDKHQMYQIYDITNTLKVGNNAIGISLGEGWWSGNATFVGKAWNYFGDRQSVLVKMLITYKDGSEKVIVSNPSDWKYYNDGPIVYSSMMQGEVYNAEKEKKILGWNNPKFNDSNWKKATEVLTNGTTNKKGEAFNYGPLKIMEWLDFEDFNKTKFFTQPNDSVREVKTIFAKSVKEVRPNVYVYDLGQNMVGIPEIKITNGVKGDKITIRYAEVLYPDLPEYSKNVGMIMLENIRGALAQDIYILKGGSEIIKPHFTSHGFKYIEITGIRNALPIENIKGKVISSVKDISSYYESSNEKVNKLWENITWSTRSNFLSIPTDCPQRNERMGWSGDISVFSKTATYLTDSSQFLKRHLMAMRDTQNSEGRFDDVAPIGGGFGGILWGSAGITVAWETYQQFGDKQMLEDHYSAMAKYISYLEKTTAIGSGFLGDWLSPEGSQMGPNERNYLIWDAYYAYDLELMAKMAKSLGKESDYTKYNGAYKAQKDLFNNKYIDSKTKKTIDNKGNLNDTQASYAIPLGLGIIKDEYIKEFAKNLEITISRKNMDEKNIERPEYSLMTGFIGTTWINKALSDNGYIETAYKLLQNETYPSWLYSVNQGATTIWERLNSYTKEKGFDGNNSMNSFNHYSFGAIGSWMYNYSLGIERDESSAGFKRFVLQPNPDFSQKMKYAKGYYDSMYGKIESSWEFVGYKVVYKFTVPANTSATLYLPSKDDHSILENGKVLKDSDGIKFVKYENGKIIYELKSGKYEFEVNL